MLIQNGDHAQYEIDNANTPPNERSDWPLPSFDAKDWAEAFCKLHPTVDEGVALAWFANALMRGFDEHAARSATDGGAPQSILAPPDDSELPTAEDVRGIIPVS